MAISYIGTAATGSRTSGTSHSQSMPAWLTDDLIVIWMVSDGTGNTLTASQANLTFSYLNVVDDAASVQARLAYAIAGSDQASPANATISGANEASISFVAVFRGVDTTTPVVEDSGTSVWSQVATGTATDPSITADSVTPTSGSWGLVGIGIDRNGWQTTDGQYPSNTTGIHSGESADGANDCGGGLAYDTSPTSGETYTWGTMSRNDGFVACCYEIQQGAGPQSVTGEFITSGYTLYVPEAIQNVDTGDFISSDVTYYAPTTAYAVTTNAIPTGYDATAPSTVTPGPVGITTEPLEASGATLYAPEATYITVGPTIASGHSVSEPTVAPGPVGITTEAIASGATTSEPTVAPGPVSVLAESVASSLSVTQPTVAHAVTTAYIAPTTALSEATVTPGAVGITGEIIAAGAVAYAPSQVSTDATEITGGHVSAGTVYAPSVAPGAVGITGESIASTASPYAPTVSPGGVGITAEHVASGASLSPPTLSLGTIEITGGTIASALSLYAVTVTAGASVTSGTVVSSAQLFASTLSATIVAGTVASGLSMTQPAIATGAVAVTAQAISSTITVWGPEVGTDGTRTYLVALAKLEPRLIVSSKAIASLGGRVAT